MVSVDVALSHGARPKLRRVLDWLVAVAALVLVA